MKYIPKNSKVKIKIYKSFSICDLLVAGVGLIFLAITVSSNFQGKWGLALFLFIITLLLLFPIDEERVYERVFVVFKYLSGNKRYGVPEGRVRDINYLIPCEEVRGEVVENKDGSFTSILKVGTVNLDLMEDHESRIYAESLLASIIKGIPDGGQMMIFKREELLDLEGDLANENYRLEDILSLSQEKVFQPNEVEQRINLINARREILLSAKDFGIKTNCYYIAFICLSGEQAIEAARASSEKLNNFKVKATLLKPEELIDVIKTWFNEEEILFSSRGMTTSSELRTYYQIVDFPREGGCGWLSSLFSIPKTNAYLRIVPMSKEEAKRQVDKSVPELRERNYSGRVSEEIDSIMHEEGLRQLMMDLQEGIDGAVEIEVVVEAIDEEKCGETRKEVKRRIQELGFAPRDLSLNLEKGYQTTCLINIPCLKKGNVMATSVVSLAYPFVGDKIHDKKGMLIGENVSPVFLDVFRRDKERINSNMVVFGRSGSGKSYATKALISNLITEGVKVHIFDPEGEYERMTSALGGEVLNVSSPQLSRINPLEIIRGMADESGGTSEYYYSHLQFLEELYFLMFPNTSQEVLDRLNRITSEFYISQGIHDKTDLSLFSSADYPSFSDLSSYIAEKIKGSQDSGERSRLTEIYNLLSKLRKGGSMHSLWDGQTAFSSSSNVVSYNFQSLLAGKNKTIANVQMLLILRMLENEIIKNREKNVREKRQRKICIVIDEAHVFIDDKYPVALDFMYSFAKRIRKYDGMLVVITQNILDFSGSTEVLKKASAIINASQYSLIFSLNPADISSLADLYSKASALSEVEREGILRSPRGRALLIASPHEHSFIDILATRTASATWED